MAVSGPTATKTANQLAIGLEGKDAARLVVNYDDMSVPVHSHSLGAHEAASSNLGLEGEGYPLRDFSWLLGSGERGSWGLVLSGIKTEL